MILLFSGSRPFVHQSQVGKFQGRFWTILNKIDILKALKPSLEHRFKYITLLYTFWLILVPSDSLRLNCFATLFRNYLNKNLKSPVKVQLSMAIHKIEIEHFR